MKNLIALVALLGAMSSSFGQYISFINHVPSRVSTNSVAGPTGGTGPSFPTLGPVGSYYYELLVAPSTQNTITTTANPLNHGWTDTGVMGTNIFMTNQAGVPIGGLMLGFTVTDDQGVQAALVPGYSYGSTADFAVIGWSANLGANFSDVMSWWNDGNPLPNMAQGLIYNFGISTVGNDMPLAPLGGPYNDVWGAFGGAIPGMTLGSFEVPEPGAEILAGLGGVALLLFRRRR